MNYGVMIVLGALVGAGVGLSLNGDEDAWWAGLGCNIVAVIVGAVSIGVS